MMDNCEFIASSVILMQRVNHQSSVHAKQRVRIQGAVMGSKKNWRKEVLISLRGHHGNRHDETMRTERSELGAGGKSSKETSPHSLQHQIRMTFVDFTIDLKPTIMDTPPSSQNDQSTTEKTESGKRSPQFQPPKGSKRHKKKRKSCPKQKTTSPKNVSTGVKAKKYTVSATQTDWSTKVPSFLHEDILESALATQVIEGDDVLDMEMYAPIANFQIPELDTFLLTGSPKPSFELCTFLLEQVSGNFDFDDGNRFDRDGSGSQADDMPQLRPLSYDSAETKVMPSLKLLKVKDQTFLPTIEGCYADEEELQNYLDRYISDKYFPSCEKVIYCCSCFFLNSRHHWPRNDQSPDNVPRPGRCERDLIPD